MIVTIEKEPSEYFQWLYFWNQWVLLIKMHCWVLYLLDFDLKICSGQVCKQCATIKMGIGANWAMSIRNFLRINPLQHNFLSCHFETSQSHLVKLFGKVNLVYRGGCVWCCRRLACASKRRQVARRACRPATQALPRWILTSMTVVPVWTTRVHNGRKLPTFQGRYLRHSIECHRPVFKW